MSNVEQRQMIDRERKVQIIYIKVQKEYEKKDVDVKGDSLKDCCK